MKAILYKEYGSTDKLKYLEVEKPVPKDDEVLIKIKASSINSWDYDLLRGVPFLNRIGALFKPKFNILGADVAGVVESIGKDITQFKTGDEVFGDLSSANWGGFAEYVCAPEKLLAIKPGNLSFEEAAAVPQAGVLALQAINQFGEIQPGQRILINGAGGGAGTFAIQLAKNAGAHVTAVDSAFKLEIMQSLGADEVIDYALEDFNKNGQRYDLILDMVATRSIFKCQRSLKPGGVYIVIGGATGIIFQTMFLGPMIKGKKMNLLLHKPNKRDLDSLRKKIESDKLVPIIDSTFPLREVDKAIEFFSHGQFNGKIVIKI